MAQTLRAKLDFEPIHCHVVDFFNLINLGEQNFVKWNGFKDLQLISVLWWYHFKRMESFARFNSKQ